MVWSSVVVACAGASTAEIADGGDLVATRDDGGSDAASGNEGDGGRTDGGGAGTGDGGGSQGNPDGVPHQTACTSTFGHALTSTHGRIDGYLVAIVPVGTKGCNEDGSHLHLQVQVSGAVYDIATNLDGVFAEKDAALVGAPWSEGWHPGDALDYPTALGLHSSDFAASSPAALRQKLTSELEQANHVSIFATGYGPGGAHLVHRNGKGNDGAIFIRPLSGEAHVLAFSFTDTASF